MREGGVVLQVLPIYTEEQFIGEGALRRAMRYVEATWRIADEHAADVAVVTSAAELDAALATGRIALVLAFEGMEPVAHDVDLIDSFWRLGVRMASLTWNRRTMFADGLGESATGAGLTTLGRAAIERMETLGMIVDVSHLSDAGFDHVAEVATKPFVASHSSCRAVHGHPRNLTDDMLRTIVGTGGFACLNAYGGFVGHDGPSVDDYLDHIAHAVEIVGADHVGLGLDFVADIFVQMDPIVSGVLLEPGQLGTIDGLERPADLAALGAVLVERLGEERARAVASGTLVAGLRRSAAGLATVPVATYDAVVIGAGIAGLATGAELARARSVLVLDDQPTHATQSSARSASSWIPRYGADAVGPLTIASREWYASGGAGFVERSLLAIRPTLVIARDPASAGLRAAVESGMEAVDASTALEHFPPLRQDVVGAAALDRRSADIDTPVAIEAFKAQLEAAGGVLQVGTATQAIRRDRGVWHLRTSGGDITSALIVDAAGAWGDEVAGLAGVPPLGLCALRRTACLVSPRTDVDLAALPLLMEADEAFYVKPESGALLASPADETEQPPGPAEPAESDVEDALAQVRAFTTLEPLEPSRRWAGLRTFTADRSPVLGPDALVDGWAWCVGLGGFGIMTAPAVARSVVALVDSGRLPEDVVAAGGIEAAVRPDRLGDRR